MQSLGLCLVEVGKRAANLPLKVAGALLVVVLSVTGCADGVSEGDALAEDGVQAKATLGLTGVRVGDDIMFALPAFDNQTNQPIKIASVRVLHVSAGFQIVDYRTLRFEEYDGMMLTWDERTANEKDALARSDLGVKGMVIPKNSVGKRYALVHARVTSEPDGPMKDVEVVYDQAGITYRQTMTSDWRVEMKGNAKWQG